MAIPFVKDARYFGTDFVGGSPAVASEPFVNTLVSTGLFQFPAAGGSTVNPNNFGIVELGAGVTAATGSSALNVDNGLFSPGLYPAHFRTVFRIPTLANSGVLDFTIRLGFYNSTTGTDGVWFSIDATNKLKLNWLDNNVGQTAVDVSGAIPALVANTWYQAIIDINVPLVNSNQAAEPLIGGPVPGARFYFGPQVPATSGAVPGYTINRALATVPYKLLPGYNADGRTVGVELSITGVTGTAAGRYLDIDKAWVEIGQQGFI